MKNVKAFDSFNESEKKKDHKHQYGCVMMMLDDGQEFVELRSKIDQEDVYDPDGSYGIEDEPHVTVLFGLCDEILVPDEVVDALKEFDAPEITLSGLGIFENQDFDVLKINVQSADLKRMHDRLRQFPHVDTFPDYNPHVTLAYLKKGTGEKYASDINFTSSPNLVKYGLSEGGQIKFKLGRKNG